MLDDWEHWNKIVVDCEPSACFNHLPLFLRNVTVCSVDGFKRKKLDLYLFTVPDFPCQPGFNNSLDHGDGRQLDAAEQPKVSNLLV